MSSASNGVSQVPHDHGRRWNPVRYSVMLLLSLLPGIVARPLYGQEPVVGRAIIITEPDDRSGPRFGVAYLTRGSTTAKNEAKPFSPLTTLFGWQLEHPVDLGPEAPTLVTEIVLL